MVRAHRINGDARGAVVDGGGAGQADDAVFCCAVRRHMRKARFGCLTRDIDNTTAATACFHVLGSLLGAIKHTAERDIDDEAPFHRGYLAAVFHDKTNTSIID